MPHVRTCNNFLNVKPTWRGKTKEGDLKGEWVDLKVVYNEMLLTMLQHELTLSILTPHQSPSKPAHQPNTSCCAATRATTACDDAMAPQAVPPSWCRQSIETGANRTTVQPEGTTNKSCDAGPWPPSVGTLERVGEGSSTKSSCLSSKSSSRVPPEFLQSSSKV